MDSGERRVRRGRVNRLPFLLLAIALMIASRRSDAQAQANRCTGGIATGVATGQPRHYVFLNRDRQRIADSAFLHTAALEGAQIKYTWRELEPEKDRYDLSAIRHDLAYLSAHG